MRRAYRSYKFGHRGVADLTIDRLVGIHHREPERQPFVVITNYLAPRQRHRMPQSPSFARLRPSGGLCREGVVGEPCADLQTNPQATSRLADFSRPAAFWFLWAPR
jgi:hypothetical protein